MGSTIHINGSSDHLYKLTENLLKSNANCISFGDLNFDYDKNGERLMNILFQYLYKRISTIKSIFYR
jgi:hypothetical protein